MKSVEFAKELRAIGQDLEIRGIRCFDLRYEKDRYVVEGGYQAPPAPMPVALHYTADDIERLDVEGQKNREKVPAKDFLGFSQLLRGIGGYLDKRNACLVRISNNESPGSDPVFRVEYITAERETVVETRTVSSLYDICVNMYKQRGKLMDRAARYARWRR